VVVVALIHTAFLVIMVGLEAAAQVTPAQEVLAILHQPLHRREIAVAVAAISTTVLAAVVGPLPWGYRLAEHLTQVTAALEPRLRFLVHL
jgi:hypothetical protein